MAELSTSTVDSELGDEIRRLAVGYVRDVAGTTDTILAADNGNVVRYTSASAVTVTIPPNLGANFTCTLIQWGGGQLTVSPGSGVTRNSEDAQYKTSGQYAAVDLFAVAADTFWMGGSTAA
jgi:hypothetical protein